MDYLKPFLLDQSLFCINSMSYVILFVIKFHMFGHIYLFLNRLINKFQLLVYLSLETQPKISAILLIIVFSILGYFFMLFLIDILDSLGCKVMCDTYNLSKLIYCLNFFLNLQTYQYLFQPILGFRTRS